MPIWTLMAWMGMMMGSLAAPEAQDAADGDRQRMPELPRPLTQDERQILTAYSWDYRVGDEMGIWVSVDEQAFRLVQDGEVLWEVPCATGERGTGSQMNSFKTPLGWHSIRRKTGDGAPWGQVFRGGVPTGEIWKPGMEVEEDLVLTRILFLHGEEPGRNQGGNVDSYRRYIYIHGTNGEDVIGTPSSHGCIRLLNDDVIEAYDRIPVGTMMLISEINPDTDEDAEPSPLPRLSNNDY